MLPRNQRAALVYDGNHSPAALRLRLMKQREALMNGAY